MTCPEFQDGNLISVKYVNVYLRIISIINTFIQNCSKFYTRQNIKITSIRNLVCQ